MSNGDGPIDPNPPPEEVRAFFDRADAAPEYGTVETYQPGESVENTLSEPVAFGDGGSAEALEDLTYGSSDQPGEPTEV